MAAKKKRRGEIPNALPAFGLASEILGLKEAAAPEPAAATTGESGTILRFLDRVSAEMDIREAEVVPENTLQVVTFFLGRDEYGLEIARVQEVLRVEEIVEVPQAPPHVRGLTNLRGRVLPVLELKTRMGMDPVEIGEESRIVVIEGHSRVAGLLVDRAGRVLQVPESQLEPPPEGTVSQKGDYVVGLAKVDGKIVILVDVDRVMLVK